MAVDLTAANVADNEYAPALIEALLPGLHFLLGDQHYHNEAMTRLCDQQDCCLVVPFIGKNNPYPHRDDGVEVRKVLHKTRSIGIDQSALEDSLDDLFNRILSFTRKKRRKKHLSSSHPTR